MARITVAGGSVIGLTTAMMLARDGHEVTVLEGDPSPVPDDPATAWDRWDRRGVAQFHQPHNLFPRARQVMDDGVPGLTEALVDAGGLWMDPMATPPPTITDFQREPDDDRFRFVNARRPTMEAVIARTAEATDGVVVRRGVSVRGLCHEPGPDGVPHITGVATTDGELVPADLVIDATGRRSKLPEWLAEVGAAPPHVESDDSGFVYFTRYFCGEQPAQRGGNLTALGSISLLTLRSDNGTWSLTVFTASADTALRPLRDPDRFERVIAACPLQAHWLEGERISDIEVMGGVLDKYRRYVVDGTAVATGVVAVGDAWACTNPSAGRGISVGLVHAKALRDALRDVGCEDPREFVHRFDDLTEERVTPFYRNQIANDRVRLAEMAAIRAGEQPPPPDPRTAAVLAAMAKDAVVFRGMVETLTCLAFPQEVFARPGFQERVAPFVGQSPPPAPGPDRQELLALLA